MRSAEISKLTLELPDDPLRMGRQFKNQHRSWTKHCFFRSNSGQTIIEPPHDKTNQMACAPSEDSAQPGHSPSLIRVFAVRMKKAWVLSYPLSAQRKLWYPSSLIWVFPGRTDQFVGFVMRRLICSSCLPLIIVILSSDLVAKYAFGSPAGLFFLTVLWKESLICTVLSFNRK